MKVLAYEPILPPRGPPFCRRHCCGVAFRHAGDARAQGFGLASLVPGWGRGLTAGTFTVAGTIWFHRGAVAVRCGGRLHRRTVTPPLAGNAYARGFLSRYSARPNHLGARHAICRGDPHRLDVECFRWRCSSDRWCCGCGWSSNRGDASFRHAWSTRSTRPRAAAYGPKRRLQSRQIIPQQFPEATHPDQSGMGPRAGDS